jgi:hypothetical protein
MLDTITKSILLSLTCPSCGAKLKITDQVHLLMCASCGNEHMVHRDGGAIYLAPIAQDVRRIAVSTDKTAAELALPRLAKELEAITAELAATKARVYFYPASMKPSPMGHGWSLAC